MTATHEMTLEDFERSDHNRYREVYQKFLAGVEKVHRMETEEPMPPAGSYRGTFREALTITQAQWEASQQRDRTREGWLARMRVLQQQADVYADELRDAARRWLTRGKKRYLKSEMVSTVYEMLVEAMYRHYLTEVRAAQEKGAAS